jgi:hypothetical protein
MRVNYVRFDAGFLIIRESIRSDRAALRTYIGCLGSALGALAPVGAYMAFKLQPIAFAIFPGQIGEPT